jgi:hypothetical protein
MHGAHGGEPTAAAAGGDNGIVGKSQSVLIMINPIIFTRTRSRASSMREVQW